MEEMSLFSAFHLFFSLLQPAANSASFFPSFACVALKAGQLSQLVPHTSMSCVVLTSQVFRIKVVQANDGKPIVAG
jgi:hypothetical protein